MPEAHALHHAAHPHVIGFDPLVQIVAAHRIPRVIQSLKPGIVVARRERCSMQPARRASRASTYNLARRTTRRAARPRGHEDHD
ncbi:hypothetical protein DM53_4525 [Burkholderia mallei]|nr:hypothetical protein DM53_4525 [Burkholderia mallei]